MIALDGQQGFTKPNYTQMPNEVFDILMSKLSGAAFKVLCAICRQTFGWQRERQQVPISISVLCKMTGLSNKSVIEALCNLEPHYVVGNREAGQTTTFEIVFASGYENTEPVKKLHTTCEETTQVPVKKLHTLKESIKENSIKKNTYTEESKELLRYLNEKAGKNFRVIHSHTTARLKEYPLDELKMVVDYKVYRWSGDAKTREWLRQETLFAPGHIDTYLCEAKQNYFAVEKKAYDKYCDEFYAEHMRLPLEERSGKRPVSIDEWRTQCTTIQT